MRKIHILQVLATLGLGGAESRMMDVFRKIDRERYAFTFMVFQDKPMDFAEEITQLGGRILTLPKPGVSNLISHMRDLSTLMRHNEFDVVHAHTSYHCGPVLLAAKRAGVGIRIAHARTTGSRRTGLISATYRLIGRGLIRNTATDRLAISPEAGQFLFGTSPFTVVPNAIDVNAFQSVSDRSGVRREFEIPVDAFVIGQIGRFSAMKNHAFTIEWFARYSHIHPDAVLVFIGDGELRCEAETLADSLGVRNRIRFLGIRRDIARIIHMFDVTLLPSLFEGLGNVVLESQAAGIPAVVSEAIPSQADMELGLFWRCSLSAAPESWDSAVNGARRFQPPSSADIWTAFYSRGYSLEREIEMLSSIYEGKSIPMGDTSEYREASAVGGSRDRERNNP